MKQKFPEWIEPSRRFLCKYGINPYVGCENLTITRNRCHSQDYAEKVLDALQEADDIGTKSAVIEALNEMAKYHDGCGDDGEADKNDVA